MIVVEVDVRIAGPPKQVAREGAEGLFPVPTAVLPGRSVKAQVPEAAGDARRAQADQVVLAERGPRGVQNVADLNRVPARAPEFDRVPQAVPGESFQEARQPLGVGPVHLRRELPEDHRQLLAQAMNELEIAVDPRSRVRQPLHVGEIPAAFGREAESRRRSLAPAVDRARRREPVERRVQLHGREDARVVLEPAAGRQPFRIEDVPPVVVRVPAGPQVDHARLKVRTLQVWRTKSCTCRFRWSVAS